MNYLDLIPVINEKYLWELTKENFVVIYMDNKGIFNKVAQKILDKPKTSEVELDGYGSYVWQKIDGLKSIYDIAQDIIKDYGDENDMAIKRIVMFFQMLRVHHLVTLKKAI